MRDEVFSCLLEIAKVIEDLCDDMVFSYVSCYWVQSKDTFILAYMRYGILGCMTLVF